MAISVIVPTHKEPLEKLLRCLQSIRSQAGFVQIVVVDDAPHSHSVAQEALDQSNPEPWDVCLRVEYRNASAARNAGYRVALCPYLFFCDADVTLKPGCLETLMEALVADPRAWCAYCDFTVSQKRVFKSGPWSANLLLSSNYISTMSLFKNGCFPGFDEDLDRFQDWALYLKIARLGGRGVHVPQVLFDAEYGGVSKSAQAASARRTIFERYG